MKHHFQKISSGANIAQKHGFLTYAVTSQQAFLHLLDRAPGALRVFEAQAS